jgi:superfamily II DNA or RNA helicase
MVCKHVWDGWNRRYNVIKQSFRSGLLNSVCKFLQAEGYRVTVYGYPPPSKFEPREATHESRQFQIDGAKSVLEVPFHKFGIFQAPPRSGKTNIMVSIVDSERKFPVVVFCRSKDLMAQTMRRFQKYLPTVAAGCVGDGIVDIQDVTVITVQSAFAAYNEKYKDTATDLEKDIPDKAAVRLCIRNARVVFYDEVHHAHSRTSRFVLDKCKSAEIRIGMSATPHPDNEEEMKIEETVGPIVHKISYSVLIEAGFILRPYIYMYSLPEMIIDDHYKAVYKEAVSENEYLTDFIRQLVEQLTQKGKSVVIQTDYTKHTKILAKVIPNSYILTGKETTPERNEILEKLNRKEILCVVSTLFEEGLDVPSLDYTINAAGGLSNVSTLQRMRSMTAHDGKTTCGVIDFYHDCKYLRDHSEVRKEQYLSEPAFVFEERSSSTIGDLP